MMSANERLCPAPDYAAPIMGVRGWMAAEGPWEPHSAGVPILSSMNTIIFWEREMAAQCPLKQPHVLEPHTAPREGCTCGLYAYYDVFGARAGIRYGFDHVLGVVSASGDVILCERGFRAQKMRVEALISYPSYYARPDVVLQLAENYAVPVLQPGEVEGFCHEGGVVLQAVEPRPQWQRIG